MGQKDSKRIKKNHLEEKVKATNDEKKWRDKEEYRSEAEADEDEYWDDEEEEWDYWNYDS